VRRDKRIPVSTRASAVAPAQFTMTVIGARTSLEAELSIKNRCPPAATA
jgi:hypothetical protein